MKFRFPIVIIDEDYRAENTSGLGIRALAKAIEEEGFEVVGASRYGDLAQFAQQQNIVAALDFRHKRAVQMHAQPGRHERHDQHEDERDAQGQRAAQFCQLHALAPLSGAFGARNSQT